MDYLTNDDVLLEIFLQLPAKSLHRVKCVSKRWHSLISDPCFARSFIHKHPFINILFFKVESSIHYKIESVLGLPLHDDMTKVSSSTSNSLLPLSFDFIPALQLNRYNYHNNCSLKGVTEKVLVDMDLRGNCAGLVLVRAVFQDRTDVIPYYKSWRYYIYYLCNPITKQWIELPSISTCDLVGFTCYYLPQGEGTRIWADTGYNIIKHNVNYNPNKIEYTVVSINKYEHNDVLIIRVFSSTDETSEWKSFRVPCPCVYKSRDTFTSYRVLFSNGKFHWTGGTCIVAYDPFNEPEKCDIIPLPPMDPPRIDARNVFSTYDGRIRVGTPLYTGKCSVWELADYANMLWVKKYDLNVKVYHPSQHFPLFVGAAISPFFVGAAIAGEKAYVVARHLKNTIMVLDMRNASLQYVYTYCSNSVNRTNEDSFISNLESYISSPWPTTVPLLQRK